MNYKNTLNLPKTDFPMKANLAKREPEIIRKWEEIDLYRRILEKNRNRKKFVLHDGPPYANGRIHQGTILNKILKDIVVRYKNMSGYFCDFIPGWDCHGLPIELKVEEEFKQKGKNPDPVTFRMACRDYARRYIDIQRDEFKRFGVIARWDKPYLTMERSYEAQIIRELAKVAQKGLLYKQKKPVYWCWSCRTALAEAEVEYKNISSPSIYVKFKMKSVPDQLRVDDREIYVVIWTTTPWTLPANLAVALNPNIRYSVIAVDDQKDLFVIAEDLIEDFVKDCGFMQYKIIKIFRPDFLDGLLLQHPFLDCDSVIIFGDHVTVERGTGCVHTAPGHGEEDYIVGLKYGLDIYSPVDEAGRFTSDYKEMEGEFVFDADKKIVSMLDQKGVLLNRPNDQTMHSYPHCWRCKNPVIFRATEQWFIDVTKSKIREDALREVDKVRWIPEWGKNRISGLLATRPDWCISRQRLWGMPIPAFKCKSCDKLIVDPVLISYVADIFEKEGSEIWFDNVESTRFLPDNYRCPECGAVEFDREMDILDVWFDSGVSHTAVCDKEETLNWPADLYLEGSDQHRGWFHTSLLHSLITKGSAPYRAVLTHGFVVDGEGKKISKSQGNFIPPSELLEESGAEIFRLWASYEDYTGDVKISREIFARLKESYRKIRNTIRYMLGVLFDFDPEKDSIDITDLELLDKWMLDRLFKYVDECKKAYDSFEFHKIYHKTLNLCINVLSSFYLDVTKERFYVLLPDDRRRRSAQTAVYIAIKNMLICLAPILVFTTDEAWSYLPKTGEESIHLVDFQRPIELKVDERFYSDWDSFFELRDAVLSELEKKRKEGIIGQSLDAQVYIKTDNIKYLDLVDTFGIDQLREMLILSGLKIEKASTELKIEVKKAKGNKCARCWHYSTDVDDKDGYPSVCNRCFDILRVLK